MSVIAGTVLLVFIICLWRLPILRLFVYGASFRHQSLTTLSKDYAVDVNTNVREADKSWHWEDVATLNFDRAHTTDQAIACNVQIKRWGRVQTGLRHPRQMLEGTARADRKARIFMDAKGFLRGREYSETSWLAHIIDFVVPDWPPGGHRYGETWDEPVQWKENFGPWTVLWSGTLHWRVDGFLRSRDGAQAHLLYTATVVPQITETPFDPQHPFFVSFHGQAGGEALVGIDDDAFIFNRFHYNGVFESDPQSHSGPHTLEVNNEITVYAQ